MFNVGKFLLSFALIGAPALTETYVVTHFAGTTGGGGFEDGQGSAARFLSMDSVAVDRAGNVYVADTGNHTLRKITRDGIVTTLAGVAGQRGSADGVGSEARFYYPHGIAIGRDGNFYVTDSWNHTIRRVTPRGSVSTLAGLAGTTGNSDGRGREARFNYPFGIAVGRDGNIYVADEQNCTIRKVTKEGAVTTLAGQAGSRGNSDGTGAAARFNEPRGVATDDSGNVYVADTNNRTIRSITPKGLVATLSGAAGSAGSADGALGVARFNHPLGVATDRQGNVYVGDTHNHTVRKISRGVVTTIAGEAGIIGSSNGRGGAARFNHPIGLAIDRVGNIFVADYHNHAIRKITPSRIVTTVAGMPAAFGSTDGIGVDARFTKPLTIGIDSASNLYVRENGGQRTRRITPSGIVTTEAGVTILQDARTEATDGAGNTFRADTKNHTILRIAADGSVSTVAGLAGTFGSSDGIGEAARFNNPSGISIDRAGRIYVADTGNHAIRKLTVALPDGATIDAATGKVGEPCRLGTAHGTATAWEWSIIRRPSGSSAELSSTRVRNPTFSPDVADRYQFRLVASTPEAASITVISLDATPRR